MASPPSSQILIVFSCVFTSSCLLAILSELMLNVAQNRMQTMGPLKITGVLFSHFAFITGSGDNYRCRFNSLELMYESAILKFQTFPISCSTKFVDLSNQQTFQFPPVSNVSALILTKSVNVPETQSE